MAKTVTTAPISNRPKMSDIPGVFRDKQTGGYMISPGALKVIPGYNVRDDFSPELDTDDRDLVHSMAVNGFQTDKPVTVRIVGNDVFVISGHRRYAAVRAYNASVDKDKRINGIAIIPEAQTPDGFRSDAEMIVDLIVSNSGKPLASNEKGAAFARLRDNGWSAKQIAARFGVTEKWVGDLIRQAKGDKRLAALVKAKWIGPSMGVNLSRVHGEETAVKVAELAATIAKAAGRDQAGPADIEAAEKALATPVNVRRTRTVPAVPPVPGATVPPVAATGATDAKPDANGAKPVAVAGIVKGPFLLGTDINDCTLYDQNGALLCEWPDLKTAKIMLTYINQGWTTYQGKQPEPKPVDDTPPATPEPVKVTVPVPPVAAPVKVVAQAAQRPAKKRVAR